MTLRKLKSKDNVEACGERGPFGSAILSPYGRVRMHVHMCVLVWAPLVLPSYLRMGERGCVCICVCSCVEGRGQPRVSVPRLSPCRVGTCLSPPLQHWDHNHTPQQPAFLWPLRTGWAPQAQQARVVSTSQTEPLAPELHCLPRRAGFQNSLYFSLHPDSWLHFSLHERFQFDSSR